MFRKVRGEMDVFCLLYTSVDESTLELILHALVKLSAAEIEPRVGRVDLRINREALAVLETKPVLEIHHCFLSAVIR